MARRRTGSIPAPRVGRTDRRFGSDPGLANRRVARRMAREIRVWYRSGRGPFRRTLTVNFSPNGARLRLEAPIPSDEPLLVMFELEEDMKLQVQARLVWQTLDLEGQTLAGVHFEMPRDVQNRVNNWVKRRSKAS
ncbi:MAG: PilZ domain-containing protein [Candidatus Eremiobacterota bacterium]